MSCNIGIIGRVADGKNIVDGQTVKTRLLRNELKKKLPDAKIISADLYNYKKRAIFVFFSVLYCFLKCENIFLLVSINGMKFFFPFIYGINKIFKRNIIHDVIGGNLHTHAENNKKWIKYLNSFGYNLVELEVMEIRLRELGVKNAYTVPNFKRLSVVKESDLKNDIELPLRFCTFSRVAKEKGILTAVEAVEKLNKKYGSIVAELDIFGQVENNFVEEFNNAKKKFTDAVKYKGIIDYNRSTEVLKDYDALLFPTTHNGEGFPGTIIDAYASALPVIATDWKYNSCLINDGTTGFVYNYKNNDEFYSTLLNVIENPTVLLDMKKNCLNEYEKYNPDVLIKIIIERFLKDIK